MTCQDFIVDITVSFGYIAVPLKCEIFEQGFRQCRHSILLLQYQKETVHNNLNNYVGINKGCVDRVL